MALSNFTRPQLPYNNESLPNDDRFHVLTSALNAPVMDITLDAEFNKVTDSLNILDVKLEGAVGGSIPGYNDPDNANFVLFTDGANQGWKLISDINCETNSISGNKLIVSSVTNAQIANGTINSNNLAPGSVSTIKIIDLNVTTAKIAANAVTTAKIMDDNVTEAKIENNAVTTEKINDDAVTTDKILDANVTLAKLSAQVAALLNGSMPIGAIMAFAGTVGFSDTIWLECNGQAVNRTTYATLFTNIGTLYGVGDGFTTFNLPDWRGRVPVGIGSDSSTGGRITAATAADIVLGGTFGEETQTLDVTQMPAHTHTMSGSADAALAGPPNQSFNAGAIVRETSSTGGGLPHPNVQPSIFARYYIRAL